MRLQSDAGTARQLTGEELSGLREMGTGPERKQAAGRSSCSDRIRGLSRPFRGGDDCTRTKPMVVKQRSVALARSLHCVRTLGHEEACAKEVVTALGSTIAG